MNIRELAESDLGITLEDNAGGFGWEMTITDPLGSVSPIIYGQSTDVFLMINFDTGQFVSNRHAEVVIRLSTLSANTISIPVGIHKEGMKPWLVTFNDINGNAFTFKVVENNPDRALGVVKLVLEGWKS